MAARLRIGVLSAAHIAIRTVGPAIASSRNAELVALASRDPSRARAFAADLGGPRVHDSYEAVLADPDVDAIYLPLPTAFHHDWATRAAERGKHVLCEKPLAMTPEECRAIEAAAVSAGVVVMEAFMYRFHPRTLKLIDLVRNAGGAMTRTRMAFTFVRPRLSVLSRLRQRLGSVRRQLVPQAWWPERVASPVDFGRGVLFGLGSYCVDLGRLMTDQGPVEAVCQGRRRDDFAVGGRSAVGRTLAGPDHGRGRPA